VRPEVIVALPPAFDEQSSLKQGVENLAIQAFIAQLRTKAAKLRGGIPW
jgi:hypothetical protein